MQKRVYIEKVFIVLPYKRSTNEYMDFDSFAEKVLKECRKIYHQDAILIKYPDKEPVFYDYRVKHTQSIGFSSATLNDVIKDFFTVLERCRNKSLKSPDTFEKEKSQNIIFEKAYMNDFPNSISEHRIRSSQGELVRFKNYPEEK